MAIADYTELVVMVAQRAKYPKLAHDADQFVDMAERQIFKDLRTADMYAEATLSLTDGSVTLPADHLSPRRVEHAGVLLGQYAVDEIRGKHLVGQGRRCGYAVEGNNLIVSTGLTGDVTLFYYAKLDSLVDAAGGTNWLLQKEPEIYFQALLFQVLTEKGEIESAATVKAYLDSLVRDLSGADFSARFTQARVRVAGPTP